MKNCISALAFGVLMSGSVVAAAGHHGQKCGGGGYGDGGGFKRFEVLAEKLELSDEQREAVKVLHEDTRAAAGDWQGRRGGMAAGIHKLDPDAADYDSQVEALAAEAAERSRARVMSKAERHKAFIEILTEEQRAELQVIHEKRMEGRGQGRWRNDGEE